jgi:hypothetical protein
MFNTRRLSAKKLGFREGGVLYHSCSQWPLGQLPTNVGGSALITPLLEHSFRLWNRSHLLPPSISFLPCQKKMLNFRILLCCCRDFFCGYCIYITRNTYQPQCCFNFLRVNLFTVRQSSTAHRIHIIRLRIVAPDSKIPTRSVRYVHRSDW